MPHGHIHSAVNRSNQQSGIELREGIKAHEANSNAEKCEQSGVGNMTRRLQSPTRKLCKINDKYHVAIRRHFCIGFSGEANMPNPHRRSVTAKRPRIAGSGFP